MARRIRELEGLRGAAAAAVVIAHYFGEVPHGLRALTWGWLGVGVFFVLSGYLIGGIILDGARDSGFVRRFFVRRVSRILPAYLITVVLVLVAVALIDDIAWADTPFPAAVYLTFTQNVAMVLTGGGGGTWLTPTWTLAVEEQFYLVLPPLLVFTPRRALAPLLLCLCTASLAFRLAVYETNELAALTLLPSRADLLLSGVLAALAQRRLDLKPHLLFLRAAPLAAVIVLLVVSLLDRDKAFAILSPALLGTGAACFILAIVNGAPEALRFRVPALCFLGRISYGLYLFHQPIAGLMHGALRDARPDIDTPGAITVTLLAAVLSLGAATASWIWLEAPLLAWVRQTSAGSGPPLKAAEITPRP